MVGVWRSVGVGGTYDRVPTALVNANRLLSGACPDHWRWGLLSALENDLLALGLAALALGVGVGLGSSALGRFPNAKLLALGSVWVYGPYGPYLAQHTRKYGSYGPYIGQKRRNYGSYNPYIDQHWRNLSKFRKSTSRKNRKLK